MGMQKDTVMGMWDHFRTIHGVTLRAMALIPKDKLDSHPIPGMRTPKELMVHAYSYARTLPESALKANLSEEDCKEPVDRVKTVDDLIKYARECFAAGDAAVKKVSEAQLAGMVSTVWGVSMPGWMMISIVPEEHLHHRGQLYAYLRIFGIEPPFMWGFEQNEPALQPQTQGV
jgi:uncharacterized damage-inducible protein DinB